MTTAEIEQDVRSFCDTLSIGYIHIETAVAAAVRAGDAEFGKLVANRMAARILDLRERFKPHFDRKVRAHVLFRDPL